MIHSSLKLTDDRSYFKPFRYPQFYERWLDHEKGHWLHTEVSLQEDITDWNKKLTTEEKTFLTNIFRFFTQSDIDVASGYVNNYLPYFPQPEVRMMLMGFAAREAVHIAAYSHLIETIGMPESVYNEFLEYEAMREKHEYFMELQEDKGDPASIAVNIAAFSAFTEGLQLFSSFIMLLNFTRFGKMKGMGQIISWSTADESQHCESMIELFRIYIEENPEIWNDETKGKIYTIAEKMVELEDKFIDICFAMGGIEGLTPAEVKKYIRYIADRRLISMGMRGIFRVKRNPLLWVESMLNAPTHGNFFEQKVTEYAKGAMKGSWGDVWV